VTIRVTIHVTMVFNQITPLHRFFFLLVFSAALMIVDHRSSLLVSARAAASVINRPFQWVINRPAATREWLDAHYRDGTLYRKYKALQAKQSVLEAHLQRYEALQAENRRLSRLLSASPKPGERVLLAEVVEIGLEPFTHRIGLNLGVESGVYLGQAVILPDGVLGQVSGLGFKHSVVTLITDPSHAIPVQIQRSGLRTMVRGLGVFGQVSVPFLSAQADIRQGDLLVTSGLGGGFPAGYKVAQVQEIVTDSTAEFLTVRASPLANIKSAKEVLLLFGHAPPSAPPGSASRGGDEKAR